MKPLFQSLAWITVISVLTPKSYAQTAADSAISRETTQIIDTQSRPAETEILPSGIMTLFGSSQVIFKTQDASVPTQKAYVLGEGEMRDGIKVIRINHTNGVITFENHGLRQDIRLPNAQGTDAYSAPDGPDHPAIPRPDGVGGGYPPYLGGDENTGQPTGKRLTKEQQVVMIEAQRLYYKSKGDPESLRIANSLPPTAITPDDAYDLSADNTVKPPQVQ